jgi:aldehyde dehydrogenase (NAD+)
MTPTHDLLRALGVHADALTGGALTVRSPIDGATLAQVHTHSVPDAQEAIGRAHTAFAAWRDMPAPRRGELVRLFGEELRNHKRALGELVSLEVGKITSEGLGEVQEMIDICDFAVGLSRQLHGLTIASERPGHRMMETWHPLGVVGVISAFNFPVAVWSWNSALALVCGDPVVWKPSDKTPLTALATQALFERALARFGAMRRRHLSQVLIGGAELGEALADDPRVALLSATGSTAWAAPWRRAWRRASAAACWSWAATTPPSWHPRALTWISRCAASCSAPPAPPASAAPPRAG